MHDPRTGEEARRALRSRHVAVEFRVDAARTLDALGGQEPERPAAGRIADLRVGIGLGDALRHDHAVRLRQRDRHQRERLLQPDADDTIRRRRHLVRPAHHRAAERIALTPAQNARDAIAREHLLAVMEAEAVAQRKLPDQAVALDRVALDHLRMRLEIRVQAVQQVVDHVAVVAGDVRRGPHRIERCEVRVRNEAQFALRLSTNDARRREHRRTRGRRCEYGASADCHDASPCRLRAGLRDQPNAAPPVIASCHQPPAPQCVAAAAKLTARAPRAANAA